MPRNYPEITAEQTAALQGFANKHGRKWKGTLSDMWMNGQDERQPNSHLLRQVRNQFGPSWLYNVCKVKPE
jgi:hypothetical protein